MMSRFMLPFFFPLASARTFRTVAVQVVHRHGDRTPITPLKDEKYWQATLVNEATLAALTKDCEVERGDGPNRHSAGGRGPFGKLTQLGILQMIGVGTKIRDRYTTEDASETTESGDTVDLFLPKLDESTMQVYSTDFQRTIQSVQGFWMGFFHDQEKAPPLFIDARNTNWMIPDPQPRRFAEQHTLEQAWMANQPETNRDLAVRVTQALHPLLAEDAHEAAFGVLPEEDDSFEVQPLGWNQLAEVTKCLQVRELLPTTLDPADVQAVSHQAASKWFQMLQTSPRLVHLAMGYMAQTQVEQFSKKLFTVWSAHDSTLIGLLCMYRLEMPATWPEYASYLLLELLVDDQSKEFVRFSLNGQVLASQWPGEERYEMIPLDLLRRKVQTEGASPEKESSYSEYNSNEL